MDNPFSANYEKTVSDVFVAIRSGDETQINQAFSELAELNSDEVLAEIILCLEDAVADLDLVALLSATRQPLPDHARQIIEAVLAQDFAALQSAIGSRDFDELLGKLLMITAALQETRTRLV